MRLTTLPLLALLCFSAYSQAAEQEHLEHHHTCHHDEIEQDIQDADVDEDMSSIQEGRVLASTELPNLRIYPYYDALGSTAFEQYVRNQLVPPIVSYFASALKIRYPISGNLKLSTSVRSICSTTVPSILYSPGVPADLFIYYDTYSTQQFVAYASACYSASGTKRPIIAKTMINSVRMENGANDPVVHETNMYTIMHETMHALGFDNYQFNNFIDLNGNRLKGHVKSVQIAGKTRTVVDLPNLTQKLRDHFGCSTIPGAIMENDGGSGTANSHFETKYFLWEAMCSSYNYGRRISEFSLGFLEGTGWYAADYSYAEPYFFGQGQGCDFINNVCSTSGTPKFDEYCIGSGRGCARAGRGGGPCVTSSLMENCKAYRTINDYDCDSSYAKDYARLPGLQVFGRGAGSKCFSGTLNTRSGSSSTSFCFKYTCVGSGSSTQVQVQVGSNTITCNNEGTASVNGYSGVIDCPDPLTFCNTAGQKYCPLNCAGRGDCVNGKCECYSGFKGVDCAMKA